MMKRSIFAVLFLCVGLALVAQGHYYLELPYENVNGKLMIKAKVEGVEGRFVFDTGAPLYITAALAEKLQAEAKGTQGIIDAAGHRLSVSSTTVSNLVLGEGEGSLTYQGAKANIIPQGNMIEAFGIDGIIGTDIMPYSVVRLDSKRQMIIITDDAATFRISPRCRMAMETNQQNCPFVQVNVGKGVIETPLFDSGSPALYALSEQVAQQGIANGAVQLLGKGYGTSGFGLGGESVATERSRVQINDLRMGTGKFRRVVTQTNPGASLIGTGLLKYGYVTLDFAHKAFYFEPFEQEPVDCYEKAWNLDITYHDGHILVSGAWDEMREQVELGEEIVAVDGKPLPAVTLEEALRGNLLKITKDEARIKLRKPDGSEHEVKIERK